MEMKLVEYDLETGRFRKFLQLAECDIFNNSCDVDNSVSKAGFLFGYDRVIIVYESGDLETFQKDEKDPLNRLDGLFNGRTYGNGRFVLIENDEDGVIESNYFGEKYHCLGNNLNILPSPIHSELKFIGNLHENPELWEKVK